MHHPTNSPTPISYLPAVVLALAVASSNGLARFAYGLLVPAMREDLHWDYASAGWLNSANSLGYLAGAVLAFFLLRRLTAVALFRHGLVLIVVALLTTALWRHVAWLSATRFIAGVGAAWVFACGGAIVSSLYAADTGRRGRATAIYFAGAGFGVVLSGLAVPMLLATHGSAAWPEAWVLLGGMSMVMSITPWVLAGRTTNSKAATAPSRFPLRPYAVVMAAYLLFAAGYIVYFTFLFAWIREAAASWTLATLVWVVLGLGIMVSPFVWQRPLERWPPVFTLGAACALCATGTAMSMIDLTPALLIASAFVFGIAVFIAPAAVTVLARTTRPASDWAALITLFTTVFAAGQAVGPMLAGWIADVSTLRTGMGAGAALLTGAALLCFWQRTRSGS